jgi:conjugative transfer signal peptidase TraF
MAGASSIIATISWRGRSSAVPVLPRIGGSPWRRVRLLIVLGLSLLMATWPSAPLLLWNASPSVPIGLYLRTARPAHVGTLALLRLPEPVRSLAAARGYLPAGILLIKPVAGHAGDLVCRLGPLLAINARTVARAARADRARRPLPRWRGCRRLRAAQVFVLSPEPDSFDGRYFGPLDRRTLAGTARPVWTPSKPISGRRDAERSKTR